MQDPSRVMDRLEAAAKNADGPLEERIANSAVWWYKNKGLIPRDNLTKRLDFQEEMITLLFDILVMVTERQNVQGASKLLRPRAVMLHDPIRA